MPNFICTSCRTQYAESDQPPAACAVCQDERQYVKVTGQQWTTWEPFEYDRVYGAFKDMVIERDGKAVVKRSAERYLRTIGH